MSSAAALSKPFIRETTLSDIQELALTMREIDRKEISFSSEGDPLVVLTRGFEMSDQLHTVERDGKVMAIFGVVGVRGVWGSPWMLGSPGLEQCRSLLRECRKVLDGYAKDYSYLTNAVWCKNTVHINWIRWLGFSFDGSELRKGETFIHFYKEHHV